MKSNFTSCSCAGKNLDKLVKPAVMAILARGSKHGYAILNDLAETGFFGEGEAPDTSGVYRILKEMDALGLVTTQWDLASHGPARRVYTLTESGLACLQLWDETLEKYQARIQQIRNLIGEAAP